MRQMMNVWYNNCSFILIFLESSEPLALTNHLDSYHENKASC